MARSRALLVTAAGAVAFLAAVPAAQANIGIGAGSDGLVAKTAAAAPAAHDVASSQRDRGGGFGKFQPGAPGVGDPYFPLEGNGGYDTQHYDLSFSYDPATDRLEGLAVITAEARRAGCERRARRRGHGQRASHQRGTEHELHAPTLLLCGPGTQRGAKRR